MEVEGDRVSLTPTGQGSLPKLISSLRIGYITGKTRREIGNDGTKATYRI
ncbi:MAG: hypothetical protein ACFFF4_12710 [Candidatus Thorarchaeota archaeon]